MPAPATPQPTPVDARVDDDETGRALEDALEAAGAPADGEPEIAADDAGATAFAEDLKPR